MLTNKYSTSQNILYDTCVLMNN